MTTTPTPIIPDAAIDAVTRLCMRYEMLFANHSPEDADRRIEQAPPAAFAVPRRQVENTLFALQKAGYRVVPAARDA